MYYIGVDLGGTNIAVGIVNENGELLRGGSVPTGADREADLIIKDMAELCKKLIAEEGLSVADIEYAGIATPGSANSDTGVVAYAHNLPFLNYPLAAKLQEFLGVKKVLIENDANAAAKGEAACGAAKGFKDSVMITLGTGLGGGIIIDNKVYSGFNHAGAELGHVVIELNGKPCSCGRKGCWEAYSSATGLIRMTREKIEACRKAGRETLLEKLAAEKGKISGRTAFDAKRAGDEAGAEVVADYVKYLAEGLANIVNIFQPQVISIGGGIANEKQYLLDLLLPEVHKRMYGGGIVTITDIRIAELGNNAGIIGAAML